MTNETKYEIVKFINGDLELDVNVSPNDNTIWLTQQQMSVLFLVKENVITYHIKEIYLSKELNEATTTRKIRVVRKEGNRNVTRELNYYDLDVIISVGYRVNSLQGIVFRRWANNILKEYLLRGYVINDNRTLVTNENYIELINKVNSIDNRVLSVENKLTNKDIPTEKIFFSGEVYDAKLM